jgi:hypothetical protein
VKQVSDRPYCTLSAIVFAGSVVVGTAGGEGRLELEPGTRQRGFVAQQRRPLAPAVLVGAG